MFHDLFTNKWKLGGIILLIAFVVAGILWIRHDIATVNQLKREAVESDKILHEWEASQKADLVPNETIDSMTPEITDETIVETVDEFSKTIPSISFDKPAEVRYSPNGLGPYPEVSKEYFLQKGPTAWQTVDLFGAEPPSKGAELISRVLLKLWKEGDTEWQGGTFENGKVYVNYPNRVYIRYSTLTNLNGKPQTNPDGTPARYISMWQSSGDVSRPTHEQLLAGEIPSGVEIIDLGVEDVGIEPYSFLGLDK